MRAVLCTRPGDPAEVLELTEIEPPALGPDALRVRVAAASVNFPDLLMVQGLYQDRPDPPFVVGLEGSGTVVECGAEVRDFKPGDRVLLWTIAGGTYADEVVVPARHAARIPENMDLVAAGGFLTAYGTAYYALSRRARLEAGETLLVTGAAGGVGLAAVEIGKVLGATVIACARGPAKLDAARAKGADFVIDYEAEDLRTRALELTEGKGANVIYDPVGGAVFDAALGAAAWWGRALVIGFAGGEIQSVPANRILFRNISVIGAPLGGEKRRNPALIREVIEELFALGDRLELTVSETFPLGDAARAFQRLAERAVIGKVLLIP